MKIKRILILGHSNIGDVCYDLVVIAPIRKQYPGAKIYFLTSSRAEDIVRGYPGVDTLLIFDRSKGRRTLLHRLGFMIRLVKMRFDLAVVLKKTCRQYFMGIPRILDLRRCVAYSFSEKKEHIVDSYFKALRLYKIDPGEPVFHFNSSRDEDGVCADFLRSNGIGPEDQVIGILPFAAWSLKSWPMAQWNALADVLMIRYGYRVIAFSRSGGDGLILEGLKEMSCRIVSADNFTLPQVMGLLKRCDLFIGPDSSLLHIASCMGVEAIGLYGPTPDKYIYPYFHRHNVIKAREHYACMPCTPRTEVCSGRAGARTGRCMDAINMEDILNQVKRLFPDNTGRDRAGHIGSWCRMF